MLKPILGIVLLILLSLSHIGAWKAGRDHQRAENAKDIARQEKLDEQKVEKVIEYRDKIRTVYRDKIKYIQQAKDTTGCADTSLADMGLLP